MIYTVKINGKNISLTEEEIELKIIEYEKNIKNELDEFNKKINEKINKPNIYLQQLDNRIKFVRWSKTKYKLNFSGRPNKVFKREIFYCELGNNVGSEQSGHRPVVILQNDIGNRNANTTIIAPITTHQGTIEMENEKYVIKFKDSEGKNREKILDFYEIPIQIEDGYKEKITGFANIAHLREIDKKRLNNMPVAKITENTLKIINNAIKLNLDI